MPAYDVIVVGSGVAGLSVALGLAGTRRVAVVTSGVLGSGSTVWAQGGIAAAIGEDDDPRLHAADTLAAGAGMCGEDVVRCLSEEAPGRLAELVAAGAALDRDDDGRLSLTREGGHHRRRVAHAGGDASGAEVSRSLVAALRRTGVDIIEGTSVLDLTRAPGRSAQQVTGVRVRSADVVATISARAVVLATGGIGGLYEASTNPPEVGGDGLALASRAGASLVDLEFVQFHPTALRIAAITGQIPLVSEALRGEGAVLRDLAGRRIMAGHHSMADLAPRDIVARRVDEVSAEPGGGVVLDATGLGAEVLRGGFPTVYDACRRHGIDPVTEPIPVAPAQHFLCGGVRTDRWGATDVTGLYAVGEVAATGVHGANRLASNSLVEGMVFGRRVAARLTLDLPSRATAADEPGAPIPAVLPSAIPQIQATMTRYAGIRRTGQGLEAAAANLGALASRSATAETSHDAANRWTVAVAIVAAAHARRESRGCHWRGDYPATSEHWRRPVVIRLDQAGSPEAITTESLERSA
jgi:L-aspartate oxidase